MAMLDEIEVMQNVFDKIDNLPDHQTKLRVTRWLNDKISHQPFIGGELGMVGSARGGSGFAAGNQRPVDHTDK